MKALIYVIPLPYLGIMAGWAVAEIGRQPWIVYGLMRTSDAVSPVPTSSVGLSLAAFIVIYTFLGILDIYLDVYKRQTQSRAALSRRAGQRAGHAGTAQDAAPCAA